MHIRTESITSPPPWSTRIWRTWLHYRFTGLKSIFLIMLLKTWELQRHYWKRRVLAHIIGIYCINNGKSCSYVIWELKGKSRWSRSLSVSRPVVFQKAVSPGCHCCPPLGSRGQPWAGYVRCSAACTAAGAPPWCPHSSGDEAQINPTAPQFLSFFSNSLFCLCTDWLWHIHIQQRSSTAGDSLLWIYGWLMSLFKIPHRTKQL